MQAYGSDRLRQSGDRWILLSAISKGWTPRTPKSGTHAEFPGTTVLWDDQYFEVIEAAPMPRDAVRYVLAPWREEHTIRTFERYDGESEAQRRADYERAQRQRKVSILSRLSGIALGHLPEPVQIHLQNELGVVPTRMTLLSCIPALVLAGVCFWLKADAMLKETASPIPTWLWILVVLLLLETIVRFIVAMSHARGIGSTIGTMAYLVYWGLHPNRARLVPPFGGRGYSTTFMIPPPDDVALRDALTTKAPLLTLLTPAEQHKLAARYGFDYRKHAYPLAFAILVVAVMGAVSSYVKVKNGAGLSPLLSMFAAAAVALEQLIRLYGFQRGPAGSIFAPLVRPFVKDLL
ncbi:MAG: hypothetical protein ACLGH0_11485 [Thermoanaerobaculia bacterium]